MTDPFGGSMADPPESYAGGVGTDSGVVSRSGAVNLTANTAQYQQSMGQAAQSTNAVAGAVGGLIDKIDRVFKTGGRTLKIFGAADAAALGAGVASLGELDNQMSSLKATVAINRTSIRAYGSAVDEAFSNFPGHRGDVVALVTELTNLGTKQRDIGSLTNTMEKLGAASGEGIPQLTQDLVQLSRQMGNTNAQQIAGYANAVLTVSRNAGVGVQPVLSFSQAIAPISRQAGIGEAAVLGISTAFSKAGADGFVAANTFNSIVNDITTLTRTGSPELVKYANFVGMTAAQFKKLPAKDQITGIFSAIAKGGPQALNFVNELGLGTRALSAVQAVAQSGGLGKFISQSEQSSGNTNNLNRGAKAAIGGLDDQVSLIHNNLTRFGNAISAPLLTPVTAVAHVFAVLASVATDVVSHLGPLPAILGVLGTVLAPLAGLALGHAGFVGLLAGLRLFTKSGPKRALTEGRMAGDAIGTGTMTRAEARAQAEALQSGMPWRAKTAYYVGEAQGRVFGPGGGGPGVVGTAARGGLYGGVRAAGAAGRWYLDSQGRMMHDSTLNDYERSAYTRAPAYGPAAPTVRDRMRGFGAAVRDDTERGLGRSVLREGRGLVGSTFRLAGNTIGAAGSMAMSGLGTVGSGLGAIGRGLFSMPGMLALGLGVPLISGLANSWSSKQQAHNQDQVSGDLNPLARYNDALGLATNKLADFSTKVTAAAVAAAGKTSTATSFAEAKRISPSAAGQFFNKGSSDPTISALAKNNKGSVRAAVSLMQSYGITDPKQLDAFGQNLLGAGFTPEQTRQVLGQYRPGGTANLNPLATAITRSNQGGDYATNASSQSNALVAAGATSLSIGRQDDVGRHSTRYAATRYLQRSLDFAGKLAQGDKGNSGARDSALANLLATLTGGSQTEFNTEFYKEGLGSGHGKGFIPKGATPQRREQIVLGILQGTKSGQAFLANIKASGGVTDQAALASFMGRTQGEMSDSQKASALKLGTLGSFFTTDKRVQAAIGAQSGDPRAGRIAADALVTNSLATTRDFSKTSAALQKLSDAMGGASTVTGQLLASAAAWSRQLQSFRLPYMNREGQLNATAQTYAQDQAAADRPGASQATQDQAKSSRTAYEQQKQSYYQYLISVRQTAGSFYTGQTRAEQDYETSTYRSNRNFHIQMVQSEQDYTRQRARTLQDFNIQMSRQAQQAAESIYNPYARVQSQSVSTGGILVGNLIDQNRRIAQQTAQVRALRRSGLSQQAMDTLRLDDPNNAQQTNAIAMTVLNDPAMIRTINRLIQSRHTAAVHLTQSTYNEDFRNTVSDFERGLGRTSEDYRTAHDRAVASQSQALGDMARDFRLMTARSAQDLTIQMTQLYGSFGEMYGKSLEAVNKQIGKYAPALSKTLVQEIQKAEAAINGTLPSSLAAPTPQGATSGGNAGGGGSGTRSNPILRAGVSGIAPNGSYGSYDSGGHFHAQTEPHSIATGQRDPVYIGNPKSPQAINANTPAGAKQYALARFAAYGWDPSQMSALDQLWTNESGWRYSAYNSSSGAIGIPQLLPNNYRGHYNSQGHSIPSGYLGDGKVQVDWGLNYIRNRYGSPSAAVAFEFSHSPAWYAAGSVFKGPRTIGVGERGAEAVVPLEHAGGMHFLLGMYDKVSQALAARMNTMNTGMRGQGVAAGGSYVHTEDNRTFYTGDIKLAATDPADMERKLEQRARLKRLASPAHSGPG